MITTPKKVFVSFLTLLINMIFVSAQSANVDPVSTPTAHKFELGMLINQYQVREELLSRLRWFGGGVGFVFNYEAVAAKITNEFETGVSLNFARNRFEHWAGAINTNSFYQLLIKKHLFDKTFFVGGRISHDAFRNYFFSWDDSHLYWFNYLTLGPTVAMQHKNFKIRLTIPLLSHIKRPDRHRFKKLDPMTDIGFWLSPSGGDSYWAGINTFQSICLRFSYQSKNPKWSRHRFLYDFNFARFDEPRQSSIVNHTLHYRYNWNI